MTRKRTAAVRLVFHPDTRRVRLAIKHDDPLLVLVSHTGETIIVSNIDDSLEHHILLRQAGYPETDLDQFFRVIVNRATADWTFVCPATYGTIRDRKTRIDRFYRDGIAQITRALKRLGYDVPIDIPARYRRHLHALTDNGG